jgi:hypothetical protein
VELALIWSGGGEPLVPRRPLLQRLREGHVLRGAALDPPPPGTSTQETVRSPDVRGDEEIDEEQFADWVRQAARLPGLKM